MVVRKDFYAPDFLIKIDGTKIDGLEFRHGATIDVQSLSITETFNQADSFTFSLRSRHPKPGRFASGGDLMWIDDDRFEEFRDVEIELGYVNNRALRLLGYITGVSINFPESGVPTLSVRGQSLYNKLQRNRVRDPFDSDTDGDIAREIAKKMGLKSAVDDPDIEHFTVSPRGATFAEVLQNRARRIDYEVAVKYDTLIFQKPRYKVDASASITLTWGEDLLSFSPNLSNANTPTETEVRNTQSSYGGAKTAISGTVTADQVRPRLGTRSGLQIAKGKFKGNRVLSSDQRVSSPQDAITVARAQMERKALDYISGQGATIGNPALVARRVIELKGLGRRFSGKYYVTSTTHRLDANGYRTNFTAKRDAR